MRERSNSGELLQFVMFSFGFYSMKTFQISSEILNEYICLTGGLQYIMPLFIKFIGFD